ncbi:MAG: hypothetical protein DBY32_10980 [Phascolarctobacterium sp.]|nr:MAG: hypothetical protein DBY32_10980 [Phascolarctobacterium sp.]
MKKRILTMFWYDDASEVHLYKDVGGIPYALAKYCGWQATFAYNDANGIICNKDYEKYVKLDRIRFPKILEKLKLRYIKYFQVIKYVYLNARKYDVINFYHCHRFINFLCWLAKKRNPNIITYVKLDMGRAGLEKELKRHKNSGGVKRWRWTDLFTVETNKYVNLLNKLDKFDGKVKYLPNGFFSDLVDIDLSNIKKEKIILTVGRLGTYQKNTELLIESLIEIEQQLDEWKIYLVGPMTECFKDWLNEKLIGHESLKEKIVITGNIKDKKVLYKIYAKSSVFVLPSRYESWGIVLSEAMFFRNYSIVMNCCDAFNEVINANKEELGKIVDNREQFIHTLSNIINNDVDYIKIGEKASIIINMFFNWNVVIKKLEEYLRKE